MKKYFFSVLFGLLIGATSFAQNMGVDYYKIGELEIAQSIFEKQLTQNPAEANYYLGSIAYKQGNLDKAKQFFQEGLTADPEFVLNNVGLGKILLKSDVKAAEAEFSTALKKNKKDVEVLVAIADAYYVNGMKDKMQAKLNDAIKVKKSPLVYEFQGDVFKDEKNVGAASGQYEQAILFDPNYASAYIKIAQLYNSINPALSIEKLKHVIELRPDYLIAYKYLAGIYFQSGKYSDAIDSYKTFFAKGNYSIEDLTHYAASLYFKERYDEAHKLIQEGIAKDPDNFVLNRLLMYNALETNNIEQGIAIGNKFFALDKKDNDYIARDYMTYAKLLNENDEFDKALAQYELAIKLDPSQFDIFKEIAETLSGAGKSAEAADYYQRYIDLAGDKAEALDYFNMGRNYYAAAGTLLQDTAQVDSKEEINAYLSKADTAFGIVSERIPNSHLGFLFRARTNSLLDPTAELGLAKPYYEKTLEILIAKEDPTAHVRELLETYKYLSYYHYVQFDSKKQVEDKTKAIEYSQKMLELDPTNSVATQLLDALK